MILRQLDSLTTLADDAACITSITHVKMRLGNKYNIGSAASLISVVLPRYIVGILATKAL